jgi:hypothetical protein
MFTKENGTRSFFLPVEKTVETAIWAKSSDLIVEVTAEIGCVMVSSMGKVNLVAVRYYSLISPRPLTMCTQ